MTSARTAERLTRLLAMLPWAVANPGSSADELQRRFGYPSRESLLQDLDLAFVCGLPGYGPGDLIDVTIDDDEVFIDLADYFARPVRLTAPEALMLLAAGMAVGSSAAAPPALDSAVRKLRSILLPEEGIVDVDLAPEPEHTDLLRRAAASHHVVRITHTSIGSGRTTTRDVEPWAVFSTLGNWYVAGHCRLAGAERVFRVDRIREAAPLDDRFSPPGERPSTVVSYTPGPDDVTARIELSPGAAWVAEYYPVEVLDRSDDGTLVVDFSATDPAVAARLLLKLGSAARLLDGPEVAEALEDLRARILTRYA